MQPLYVFSYKYWSIRAELRMKPECLPRSPLRCNSWRSGKSCVSIPRLKLHDPLYTRNALTNMLVQEIWLLVDDTSQRNYARHLSHLNDGDSVAQARDFCPPSFHGQWVKHRQRNIGHRPQLRRAELNAAFNWRSCLVQKLHPNKLKGVHKA